MEQHEIELLSSFNPVTWSVFVYFKKNIAYLLLLWCTQITHCIWYLFILSKAYMIDSLKTSYFYESLYGVEGIPRIWHTYHAYIV
jgi:hypothetical protein